MIDNVISGLKIIEHFFPRDQVFGSTSLRIKCIFFNKTKSFETKLMNVIRNEKSILSEYINKVV